MTGQSPQIICWKAFGLSPEASAKRKVETGPAFSANAEVVTSQRITSPNVRVTFKKVLRYFWFVRYSQSNYIIVFHSTVTLTRIRFAYVDWGDFYMGRVVGTIGVFENGIDGEVGAGVSGAEDKAADALMKSGRLDVAQ